MASVMCTEQTHLMVLTKEAYEYVIGKMERRILNDTLEFLGKLPAFSLMTKNTLAKVTYYMTKQTITKGNFLYREGTEANKVYILITGEMEVTK